MIEKVNNLIHKSFNKYSGPENPCFNQKNIIFGYNGKGKSALAEGVYAEIIKINGIAKANYRFFNRAYIKDNILLEEGEKLKGVVASFGESDTNIEGQIKDLKNKIINIEEIEKQIRGSSDLINEEIKKIISDKSGSSSIKQKRDTDIKNVIAKYNDSYNKALNLVDNEDELEKVSSTENFTKDLENLQKFPNYELSPLDKEDFDTIKQIMNNVYSDEEVLSKDILDWIEKGVNIHENESSDKCKFCGNSMSLKEIKDYLQAQKSNDKQRDLTAITLFLDKIKSIYDLKDKLEIDCVMYQKLIGNDINKTFLEVLNMIKNLNKHMDQLDNKIQDFDSSYNLNNDMYEDLQKIYIKLNEINERKKNRTVQLETNISKINDLANGLVGKCIINNSFIQHELEKIKTYEENIKKANVTNPEIEQQILELKNQKSTTGDFATMVNSILLDLNIDLKLEVDEKDYVIKTNSSNKRLSLEDISEGENNLLALIFFYYELFNDNKQANFKEDIQYIIIDDPISSMDNNKRLFVMELINACLEIDDVQEFIFTHSWDDFCNIAYRWSDNKYFTFYEIKKDVDMNSYLEEANTKISPYRHDFNEILEFAKLDKERINNLDDCYCYHYPNVIRKVLEHFMEFKTVKSSPTVRNINNVKIALYGSVNGLSNNDKIKLPVLLDVCNIYSHHSIRNISDIHSSAVYLMKKIEKADPVHFASMII